MLNQQKKSTKYSFMKKKFQKSITLGIFIAFSLLFGLQTVSANFTENNTQPPNSNSPLPLNTSNTFQIKEGGLRVSGQLQTPIIRDINNFGYYVDPSGTSRMNYTVTDNSYNYGAFTTNITYDASNTGYYLNPSDTSVMNAVYASWIRDLNNGGYYLDLNGSTRIRNVYADYLQVYNHIRTPDVYIENARSWASQLGQVQTEIRGNSARGRDFSQPLGVSCREGWQLVGCSGYQSDCSEDDCGYHGVVPRNGNQCWAYYDDDVGARNEVYAYCIR